MSYVVISRRFCPDTMLFPWSSCGILSCSAHFRYREVLGRQRFRYGKNPAGKLLPTSVYISGRFRCNPLGKRREGTGIDLVSSTFPQDLLARNIVLGVFIKKIMTKQLYILVNRLQLK